MPDMWQNKAKQVTRTSISCQESVRYVSNALEIPSLGLRVSDIERFRAIFACLKTCTVFCARSHVNSRCQVIFFRWTCQWCQIHSNTRPRHTPNIRHASISLRYVSCVPASLHPQSYMPQINAAHYMLRIT